MYRVSSFRRRRALMLLPPTGEPRSHGCDRVHRHGRRSAQCCTSLEPARREDAEFYLYTDIPYAQTYPSVYQERLAYVRNKVRTVFDPEYVMPLPAEFKRNTFAACYGTQFEDLRTAQHGFEPGMVAPEEYRR